MSREREEQDATGTTNATRQRTENSANGYSMILYNASSTEISAFIAKLDRTRCASLKDVLVSLQPVIRDCILGQLSKMAKVYDSVKDKTAAVSKLIPSDDPNDRSHIPVSVKFKFELTGTARVTGDPRFTQAVDDALEITRKYQDQMAEKCLHVAKLELEGLYTKQRKLFFELAIRIAMATAKGLLVSHPTWTSDLSARDLAGSIVRQMMESVMPDEQFERLGLPRTRCRDDLINTLFARGLQFPKDAGDVMDLTITVEASKVTHDVLSKTFFALVDHLDEKQKNNDFARSLKEAFSIDVQERANEDVDALLNEEMDMDSPPLERVIADQVKQAVAEERKRTEAELRKLKQQLRAKGTGGAPGQRSEPKSNGQNNNGTSNPSSEEGTAKSRRRRRQRPGRGGPGRGNRGGSNGGGRTRGSERS